MLSGASDEYEYDREEPQPASDDSDNAAGTSFDSAPLGGDEPAAEPAAGEDAASANGNGAQPASEDAGIGSSFIAIPATRTRCATTSSSASSRWA
jgi:hypothetical protein